MSWWIFFISKKNWQERGTTFKILIKGYPDTTAPRSVVSTKIQEIKNSSKGPPLWFTFSLQSTLKNQSLHTHKVCTHFHHGPIWALKRSHSQSLSTFQRPFHRLETRPERPRFDLAGSGSDQVRLFLRGWLDWQCWTLVFDSSRL